MSSAKTDWRWIAGIAATLMLILIVNPVGYIGGGMDDWQYLGAARCWAEHGPCLPHDHWQGRWPIVAPLAAAIALFGESRLTIGLPSLAYSIGCLWLLCWLGNRLGGKPVGYFAALFLLVVPAFAVGVLDPSVEAAELFFLLGAACCVVRYADSLSSGWAFAAGLSLSLAFQVRETAIAAVPLAVLALWLIARKDSKAWLFAASGAAMPLIAELLIFWVSTGDPLWRRQLSLVHTQIASTEIRAAIDTSRSPILNPDYIANWRRDPGIHIHWLVDGLINLLCNAKAGVTLALSGLFFAMYGRSLDRDKRALVGWSLGIALYWACFLIYVLAIDPKPRMMMVPISLSALALAVLMTDRAAKGSALVAWVVSGTAVLLGIAVTLTYPHIRSGETAFSLWAARYPEQIEADETMRRHLALTKAGSTLPDIGSGRPLVILRLDQRCSDWAKQAASGSLQGVDRAPLRIIDRADDPDPGNFCLFRYTKPMTAKEVVAAIKATKTGQTTDR